MIAALGPVLLGLAVGLAMRRTGVASAEHGRFLLRLNFFVCLPALVLPAVAQADIDSSLAIFPAAAVVMVIVGYLVGRGVGALGVPAQDRAVVTMSYMVVNCAFAIPFVGAVYGSEGVVRVAAFDLVHAFLVATFVLGIAARADPGSEGAVSGSSAWVGTTLRTPLLHALWIGAVINLAGWSLPAVITESIQPFASASLGVVALGSGMVLERPRQTVRVTSLVVGRIAMGLAVMGAFVLAFGLDGIDRGVLLMLAVTPLGYVILTFAATHRLGTRLGANLLLVSIVLSVTAYGIVGYVSG